MEWYYLLDLFLNLLLHTPLTVMFWRGMWNLQDIYTTINVEHHDIISHWVVYVTGTVLSILIYLTQAYQKHHWIYLSKVSYRIVSFVYILIFGTSIVCQWRGLWLLMDVMIGVSWTTVFVTTSCAITVLVLLRSYCNVLAPPVYTLTDWCPQTMFTNSTRYRCDSKVSALWYILDTVFTVVVIHSAVILVWRGIWEFLDLALFTDDMKASALYSILIGYLLRAIVAVGQSNLNQICAKLEHVCHWLTLIIEVMYVFILSVSCICSWRGVWFILDLYLFSFDKELSNWSSFTTGVLGLMILGTFQSVLVRGCSIDGSLPLAMVDLAYFSTAYENETKQMTTTSATKQLVSKSAKQLASKSEDAEIKVDLL